MANFARMIGNAAGVNKVQPPAAQAAATKVRRQSTMTIGRCRQRPVLPELQLALRTLFIFLLAPMTTFAVLAGKDMQDAPLPRARHLVFVTVSFIPASYSVVLYMLPSKHS